MALNFNRNFYEQVNGALTSVADLKDAAMMLSGLLLDPNMFAYSRALMLSYNETTDSFHGRVLLGAPTVETHEVLVREWKARRSAVTKEILLTHEAAELHRLFADLYTEMYPLIRLEPGGAFETKLHISFASLPENHLLRVAATQATVCAMTPNEKELAGLTQWLEPDMPVIAGRIITRMGLEGIVIASRRHETRIPLTAEGSLYQWLMNLCSSTLDNLQLISELRSTAERLEELDRMKNAFLSIVSHELRTPLTGILGFLGLVASGKTGELNPVQQSLLRRALGQANHMESMVDDLLKLTVQNSGSATMMPAEIVPTYPQNVIRDTIANLRDCTDEAFVEPELFPADITNLPRIMVDPNGLDRIMSHLLSNALKFSKPDTPNHISIEFKYDLERLYITVADTGIGMTQKQCQRIFDCFYQADFTLERSFGGLGIGLNVVALLLRSNHGAIDVESEPEKGSRFTISFPLADFGE